MCYQDILNEAEAKANEKRYLGFAWEKTKLMFRHKKKTVASSVGSGVTSVGIGKVLAVTGVVAGASGPAMPVVLGVSAATTGAFYLGKYGLNKYQYTQAKKALKSQNTKTHNSALRYLVQNGNVSSLARRFEKAINAQKDFGDLQLRYYLSGPRTLKDAQKYAYSAFYLRKRLVDRVQKKDELRNITEYLDDVRVHGLSRPQYALSTLGQLWSRSLPQLMPSLAKANLSALPNQAKIRDLADLTFGQWKTDTARSWQKQISARNTKDRLNQTDILERFHTYLIDRSVRYGDPKGLLDKCAKVTQQVQRTNTLDDESNTSKVSSKVASDLLPRAGKSGTRDVLGTLAQLTLHNATGKMAGVLSMTGPSLIAGGIALVPSGVVGAMSDLFVTWLDNKMNLQAVFSNTTRIQDKVWALKSIIDYQGVDKLNKNIDAMKSLSVKLEREAQSLFGKRNAQNQLERFKAFGVDLVKLHVLYVQSAAQILILETLVNLVGVSTERMVDHFNKDFQDMIDNIQSYCHSQGHYKRYNWE